MHAAVISAIDRDVFTNKGVSCDQLLQKAPLVDYPRLIKIYPTVLRVLI
jgi:hypothetical protein